MTENVPHEIVARRMRVHLMTALSHASRAADLQELLGADWMDEVADALELGRPNTAITAEEMGAVSRLYHKWRALRDEEARILQDRSGGKVVHPYRDIELLQSLRWFEQVHPLVKDAYAVFLERGWLDEGLWDDI